MRRRERPVGFDQAQYAHAENAATLCYDMVDLWPERAVTCSGETFKLSLTDADCDDGTNDPADVDASCTVTVGDARACLEAFGKLTDAQICSGTAHTECAAIDACSNDHETARETSQTIIRAHALISRS